MMRVCLTCFFVIAFPLSVGSNEIKINDFTGQLSRLDRLFAGEVFSDALKCGQSARFQVTKNMCKMNCTNNGVMTICNEECVSPLTNSSMITVETINCTNNSVTFFSSDGDIRSITEESFVKYNKNPLRELLSQLPDWLDGATGVTITRIRTGEHTLGWKEENERKVKAIYIDAEILFESDNGENAMDAIFTLIDDKSVPWFAKAARIRLIDDGTLWRLHEINQ